MRLRLKDWLEISTVGFAQRQADRPPEHLLKEVIQNALDAVDAVAAGFVDVILQPEKIGRKTYVRLAVLDNGPGISADDTHLGPASRHQDRDLAGTAAKVEDATVHERQAGGTDQLPDVVDERLVDRLEVRLRGGRRVRVDLLVGVHDLGLGNALERQ